MPNRGQKITFYADKCLPLEVTITDNVARGMEYEMRIVHETNAVPEPVVYNNNEDGYETGNQDGSGSHNEVEDEEDDQVYIIVDGMPVFPGGETALRQYITENIRYPEMAKKNDIQGTVYLSFITDKKGKVTDVKIIRSVDPLLDEEALRLVKNLPDWKPGKKDGKFVKVSHSIPIKFALGN